MSDRLLQVGWLDYEPDHDGPFDFDAATDFHHVGWAFGTAPGLVPVFIVMPHIEGTDVAVVVERLSSLTEGSDNE